METNQSTILDQETKDTLSRRKLLPWWVKTFCWIFMIFGVCVPPLLLASLTFNLKASVELYGIATTDPLSITGLFLCLLFLLKGASAFGLWFEKDWAITVGYVSASVGILVCLVSLFEPMIGLLGTNAASFRLELIFEGLFLWKLIDLKRFW